MEFTRANVWSGPGNISQGFPVWILRVLHKIPIRIFRCLIRHWDSEKLWRIYWEIRRIMQMRCSDTRCLIRPREYLKGFPNIDTENITKDSNDIQESSRRIPVSILYGFKNQTLILLSNLQSVHQTLYKRGQQFTGTFCGQIFHMHIESSHSID